MLFLFYTAIHTSCLCQSWASQRDLKGASRSLRASKWAKKPGESLNNWYSLIFKPEHFTSCCHLISFFFHREDITALLQQQGFRDFPLPTLGEALTCGRDLKMVSYTGAVTALNPPLLTVASGNTHPSPGRAAGNMAITFSPVELNFPRQQQTQRLWWRLMRALSYGKNIKNVSGGAHWGWCPSLLCGVVSRHLELMHRYHCLPELMGLAALCWHHLMFL